MANIPKVDFPTRTLCCRHQALPLFSSPPLDGEYSSALALLSQHHFDSGGVEFCHLEGGSDGNKLLSVDPAGHQPSSKDGRRLSSLFSFPLLDGQEGPIVLSANSEQTYSAGCWSPSRPAVFFIGKEDGSIEVWDLLEKTNEPVHVQEHLSNARITCMKAWTLSCEFPACSWLG